MACNLGIPVTEKDDYYFISYNSEDADRVSAIVKQLYAYGFPMWYDQGINYGDQWEKTINQKIRGCKKFILFLTKGIFEKENPYVPKEYQKAKEYFGKNIIIVSLDEMKKENVPDNLIDWHMEIQRLHYIKVDQFTEAGLSLEILKAAEFGYYKLENSKKRSLVTKIDAIRKSKHIANTRMIKITAIGAIALIITLFVMLDPIQNIIVDIQDIVMNHEEKTSLVIIAGKHANAYHFSDSMITAAREQISNAISVRSNSGHYYLQANIDIVVNDGHPDPEILNDRLKICDLISKDQIETAKADLIEDYLELLTGDTLRATDEETDLLAALTVAQRLLNGEESDSKNILILDTGFSTHGGFDMTTNSIMDGSVDDVVSRIDSGSIPALEGINIWFYGLGTVSNEQNTMSNTFSDRLVDVWTAILVASGSELKNTITYNVGIGEEMYYAEGDADSYPLVTVVPTPDFDDVEESNDQIIVENLSLINLPNTAIQFEPDSAIFKDDQVAEAIISQYANLIGEYLARNPDDNIYVVGSIAKTNSDMNKSQDAVSKARAEAIADLLVDVFNIDEARIKVIDGGTTEFSWRNANEFPNEDEIDYQAIQENRKVVIFGDCSEELVEELRMKGYLD